MLPRLAHIAAISGMKVYMQTGLLNSIATDAAMQHFLKQQPAATTCYFAVVDELSVNEYFFFRFLTFIFIYWPLPHRLLITRAID